MDKPNVWMGGLGWILLSKVEDLVGFVLLEGVSMK